MDSWQHPPGPPAGVIFDVGRVIIRVNLVRAVAPLAAGLRGVERNAMPLPERVWAEIEADPRWRDWQEGRVTPREWHAYLSRRLDLSLGFEEFCAAWNLLLDPQTILNDDLFARLSRRCRLGLLSNSDPLHVEYIESHFTFWRFFPARVFSCKIGSTKPSPAAYHAALAAIGMSPAEVLYIDDVEEFAEAARKLGMDALRFENPQQLTGELSRRGLLEA